MLGDCRLAKITRRKRGIFLAGAIAVMVFTVVGCMLGQKSHKTAAPTSSTPAPPAAVLDGTYRLDYDATNQTTNGAPSPGENFTKWWAFRSSCSSSGCAATATALDDNNHQVARTPAVTVVYHFADGHWQSVPLRDQQQFQACLGPNETVTAGAGTTMVTTSLAPQPDGTLRGVRTETIVTNNCGFQGAVRQTPLVATRTGDVPPAVAAVADPATVTASSTTNSSVPAASGPVLNGIYRVDYDHEHRTVNGQPSPAPNQTHWRAFRSLCTSFGCVATSTGLSDDNHQAATGSGQSVYHFTNGHWQETLALVTTPCPANQTAITAHTFSESLEPQPDGTLRSVMTETILPNECDQQRSVAQSPVVTTREGDVPPGVILADPAMFM